MFQAHYAWRRRAVHLSLRLHGQGGDAVGLRSGAGREGGQEPNQLPGVPAQATVRPDASKRHVPFHFSSIVELLKSAPIRLSDGKWMGEKCSTEAGYICVKDQRSPVILNR